MGGLRADRDAGKLSGAGVLTPALTTDRALVRRGEIAGFEMTAVGAADAPTAVVVLGRADVPGRMTLLAASPEAWGAGAAVWYAPLAPPAVDGVARRLFTWTAQMTGWGSVPLEVAGEVTALREGSVFTAAAQPARVGVLDEALLESSLRVSHAQAGPGERVTYTLRVRNAAPLTRTVAVTDDLMLSGQLGLVDALPETITGGGWFDGRYVRWQMAVPGGGEVAVAFAVRVREEALSGCASPCVLRNSVSLADEEGRYNVAGTRTEISAGASAAAPDVGASGHEAQPALAQAGAVVTYEITVVNGGAGVAGTVVVTGVLPAVLGRYATVEGIAPAAESVAGRQVVWRVEALGAGETRALRVRLRLASDAPAGLLLRGVAVLNDGVNAPFIRVAEAIGEG